MDKLIEVGLGCGKLGNIFFNSINSKKYTTLLNESIRLSVKLVDTSNIYRHGNSEKIITIAYEVGFSSLAPFNKAFKKQLNKTPSSFRKIKKTERI